MSAAHQSFSIFAGRGAISRGIFEVLEDLAALNLLDNFLWVDLDSFQGSSTPVFVATRAKSSEAHSEVTSLSHALSRVSVRRYNLCIVNVAGSEAGTVHSRHVSQLQTTLDNVNRNVETKYVNFMVPAAEGESAALPMLDGFLNLMVAPEDSSSPQASSVPVIFGHRQGELESLAATTMASAFGLWEGAADVPIDKIAASPGGTSFRLVRAYFRRIDGQQAQDRIRTSLFDTSVNPRPRIDANNGQSTEAEHTDDPRRFADNAAREFWANHEGIFVTSATRTVERKFKNADVKTVRQVQFSKFCMNVLRTPQRFFKELSLTAREYSEDRVQNILGQDSRLQVGTYAMGEKTERQRRGQRPDPTTVARQLEPFWEAYANTAFSLIDANPRSIVANQPTQALPTSVSGGTSGLMRVAQRSEDVVPGPSSHFGDKLSPELQGAMGDLRVAPYDIHGVDNYQRRLSEAGQRRDIGRVMSDFSSWKNRNNTSFSASFGQQLVQQRRDVAQRLEQIQQQLRNLPNQPEMSNDDNPGLFARMLGWITFLTFIFFFGAKYLTQANSEPQERTGTWKAFADNWDGMAGSTKIYILLIWLLLWLILLLVQKFQETNAEIRDENNRGSITRKLEALQEDEFQCQLSLDRLDVGYQQFVTISGIIGALIERPFGQVNHSAAKSAVPGNKLNSNLVFEEIDPHNAQVDSTVRRLSRELYGQGWMDDQVELGFARAQHSLDEAHNERILREGLFGLRGDGNNALTTLSAWMNSPDFQKQDRSTDQWGVVAERLRRETDDHVQHDSRYGSSRAVGLLQNSLEGSTTEGSFLGESASSEGRISGFLGLEPELCSFVRSTSEVDAVGSSEILVQVGKSGGQRDWRDAGVNTSAVAEAPEIVLPGDEDVMGENYESNWSRVAEQQRRNQHSSTPIFPGEDEI